KASRKGSTGPPTEEIIVCTGPTARLRSMAVSGVSPSKASTSTFPSNAASLTAVFPTSITRFIRSGYYGVKIDNTEQLWSLNFQQVGGTEGLFARWQGSFAFIII